MSEDLKNILYPVLGVVTTVGGVLVAFLISKFASYWHSKRQELEVMIGAETKDSKLRIISYLLSHLFDIIDSVVKSLNDTWKKEMLDATSDGKLSKEEQYKLLDKAIDLVKVELPESAWNELSEIIGDVDEYLRTKIENSISLQKDGKKLSDTLKN